VAPPLVFIKNIYAPSLAWVAAAFRFVGCGGGLQLVEEMVRELGDWTRTLDVGGRGDDFEATHCGHFQPRATE
jgi:hypothetical protein